MSAQPPAPKTVGLIEKEALEKRISNGECRMANVEWRMSKECILSIYKKVERSETILRNSLSDILRFCGSLFNIAKSHTSGTAGLKIGQFNQ